MALHMNVKEFSFSLPRPSGSIPLETLNFLSQVKFDGEGEVVVFDHVHQLFMNCKSRNIITNRKICKLFTLTFEGRIKSWYEALPTKYIHSCREFMEMFLEENWQYDPDALWDELNSLWKYINDSMEQLFYRMVRILYRFCLADIPSKEEIMEAF